MTDYLPLLSRAIDGLEKSTGENRRALYERARTALVNQLRSAEPPLDESEITRERLALEEAVRKVEVQAIKYALLNEVTSVSPPEEIKSFKTSSLHDRGLRNFREKMADVEDDSAIADASIYEGHKRISDQRTAQPYAKVDEIAEYNFPPPASKSEIAPQPLDEGPFISERQPRMIERTKAAPAWSTKDENIDLQLPRDYGRFVKIIIVLLLSAAAAFGYWKRETISSKIADLRGTSRHITRPQQSQRVTPKNTDRITPTSENGPQRLATAPVAAAQKVVLYEEDPNNPQGQRSVGSAIWRTEMVSPGSGIAPELAVRADVEIPEKHMRMTWSIRRNTDAAASHLIDVIFTLPSDFPEGGIGSVSIVLLKESEQARGMQLAGLSIKVANDYFMIGLSAVDVDKQRNIQLLKERDWFDIPIVYTSGKRAILAIEKGSPGARAFEEAFRTWGE